MSLPLGSPRAGIATRPRLGEILVATGALTPLDVQRIVAVQRERGARFGEIALELGLITEAQLSCALARQIGYPYVEYGRSPLSYALAAAYEPFCAYSEAMRTLRSQLLMRWFGHKQRALAICSPRRDDMRSAVAANLAIVFAQLGERTLLIDANLRAPLQHDLFGIDIRAGLVNVICDQCGPEQALHSVAPFDKLAVMPAVVPPNPQELLSSSAFADLLEQMVARYDVVIIDTPPLLDYADAAIVAQRTGGCLLHAHRHETSTSDLKRSVALLRPTGATLLGVVINA